MQFGGRGDVLFRIGMWGDHAQYLNAVRRAGRAVGIVLLVAWHGGEAQRADGGDRSASGFGLFFAVGLADFTVSSPIFRPPAHSLRGRRLSHYHSRVSKGEASFCRRYLPDYNQNVDWVVVPERTSTPADRGGAGFRPENLPGCSIIIRTAAMVSRFGAGGSEA